MAKKVALIFIAIALLSVYSCKKEPPEIPKQGVGFGEIEPAFSPDGRFVAYRDAEIGAIILLELATGLKTHLTADARHPDWSPDSKWIVYAGVYDNIFKINVETKEIKQLTNWGCCYFPAWSPNNNRIAFDISGGESGGIWLMDTNGTNFKRIRQYARMPDWSPSGDRLVL